MYKAEDAIARVDSYIVSVTGGGRFVGERKLVCIEQRVTSNEERLLYAIVESGGKQYKVEKGEALLVDRLPAKEGDKVDLRPVMFRDTEVVTELKKLSRKPAAKKPQAKKAAPRKTAARKSSTRKTSSRSSTRKGSSSGS